MSVEYLATKAPPRQRRSWLTGLAILLVVAAVAGFSLVSDQVRRSTNQSLSRAVLEAQDRARIGEASVLSTLRYASPMIWSQEVPQDVRAGLRALVERSAGEVAATLSELATEVRGSTVLPWQGAQAEARDRVLDLILAERARFDRIAADARQIGPVLAEERPSEQDAVASLRASGADVDVNR